MESESDTTERLSTKVLLQVKDTTVIKIYALNVIVV